MSLQRPTIVIFDMDGTTVRHINPGFLHMLEWLDDLSFRIAGMISRIIGTKIESPLIVDRGKNGEQRPKLAVRRAMHRLFLHRPVSKIVEPCPGIYSLLDFLQSQGITLALVSNGLGAGYGHEILEAFGLGKYFSVSLFREDITRSKPHPDPLLKALSLLPHPPEGKDVIWHIGDRRKDIVAAIATQAHLPCPIQPLGYGLRAAAALLEKHFGHEHIIMSYPDFEKKLRRIFSR